MDVIGRMNMRTVYLLSILVASIPATFGQTTFVYDQQSSDEDHTREGAAQLRDNAPVGQSFVPTLSSVGFVRLEVFDVQLGNGIGATMHLNLRSDSLAGPLLASSETVTFPDRFAGFPNFYFPGTVPVTQGQTYFFEAVVESGDNFFANASDYNYSAGRLYSMGIPARADWDLWFREGVVVPEPSSVALFSAGAVGAACTWWDRRKRRIRCSTSRCAL